MSKFTEILAAAAIPIVGAVITQEINEGLEAFKKNNTPEALADVVKGSYSGFKLLAGVVKGTKTKLDDTAVGIFTSALEGFAEDNDIVL